MIVQHVQRETLKPGHVFRVALGTSDVGRGALVTLGAAPDDRIDIDVRYRLGEYLEVVCEFAHRELSGRQEALGKAPMKTLPPWVRLLVATFATPIFAFKKWHMPLCHFAISSDGIARRTRRGTVRESWDAVAGVDRYGSGYLIRFAWGAMPLPRRALNDEQRETFERIAARWLAVDVQGPGPYPGQ